MYEKKIEIFFFHMKKSINNEKTLIKNEYSNE